MSVREAAVELLAKHIVSDPGLAEDYFEVLVEASRVRRGRAGVGSDARGRAAAGLADQRQDAFRPLVGGWQRARRVPPSRRHARTQDNGVSVRKRAVRTLWECCARCPGFTRKTDAVVAILQR